MYIVSRVYNLYVYKHGQMVVRVLLCPVKVVVVKGSTDKSQLYDEDVSTGDKTGDSGNRNE